MVLVSTTAGTATADSDFEPILSHSLEFSSTEAHVPLMLNIIADGMVEDNEMLSVSLTLSDSSLSSVIQLDPQFTQITIIESNELPPMLPCEPGYVYDQNREKCIIPSSSEGRNFFLATPPSTFNNFLKYQHTIYVGTRSEVAGYSIVSGDGQVYYSGHATYSSPGKLTLSRFDALDFIVESSEFPYRNLGFHVSATTDEPLFVLHTQGDGESFFSSFLAYPPVEFNEEIYEYMAISVLSVQTSIYKSQIVIVASDNDTVFTVTPTASIDLPEDAQVEGPLTTVATKTRSHEINLNASQTLQIASGFDLTGTVITSNKPLTIISGHECGNIPVRFNFCEQLAVQVPPTFTWGTEFLLAPFVIRTTGQYYKIVALENNTILSYIESGDGNETTILIPKAGGATTIYSVPGTFSYLTASKPVFVVQLATGGSTSTGGDGIGDPVMLIVSPTHMYVNSTSFITLDSTFTHAISVVVDAGMDFDTESIIYNGNQLDCNWTAIENASGEVIGWGCTLTNIESSSTHTIVHEDGGTLSVLSYGFAPAAGYGYLTGMNLKRTDGQQTVGPDTPVFTDDGIPYFDLERFQGTKELDRNQDANSEPIFIPGGMIVDDRIVSSLFVSENGAFSFDKPWKFSHPEVFPTAYYYTQDADVVAPFWSDNDIRKAGTVRYLTVSRGDSKEGDEMMDTVMEYIKRGGDIYIPPIYAPTWMIVGQWDKVHPFPHGSDDPQGVPKEFLDLTNTYQGVIITDSVYSYYFFTYTCGEVNWSTIGRESAVIGMNAHGHDFYNHPASGFPNIGDAVSCILTAVSKRAPGGGQCPKEIPITEAARWCELFVQQYEELTSEVLSMDVRPNVEHCPQTLYQAKEDVRFRQDPTQGNENCRLQVIPFEFTSSSRTYSFVQQCCYDTGSNGEIYKNLPEAGALIAFDPVSQKEMYELNERPFRHNCCLVYMDCGPFPSFRPVNNGTEYQKPGTARGIGDPNYCSFDYHHFHSQGLGDFVELELISEDQKKIEFQIQSRLNSRWRGATVYSEIALGEPGNIGYQIFAEKDKLVVRQTPENKTISVTNDFTADESSTYWFKRHSNTSLTALHRSGISVQAEWRQNQFMDLQLSAPGNLRNSGRIHGIFGNYDGDSHNEFATRNNKSTPIKEANYYEYLQYEIHLTWEVMENESLFLNHTSPSRRKRAADFRPIFFHELEFNDEQRAFCKDDEHCLYDLAVTQDEGIAMTTLEAVEEGARIEAVLGNFPPSLVGDATFPVTIGEEKVYTFTVEDEDDNFIVTVVGGLPDGAILEDNGVGRYNFRWRPQNADNISITFLAVDAAGAAAAHTPQVQLCGCVNGGLCTLDGVLSLATATSVIANCICPEAYSGQFCEEDTNGCSEIECFEGVECFDVPAPGTGAKCGPCPLGYNGDGEKCIDNDECLMDSTLCDHNCTNTVGSYDCVCNEGYELIFGTEECRDIDECVGAHGCQQICSNTEGSFGCSCRDGFTLDSNQRTCSANVLCEGGTGSCSHECVMLNGMEECFCPIGMELSPNDHIVCIDIDECARFSPCHQICTDIPGSFECSCRDGFELQDDFTCKDIDECMMAGLNGVDLCQERNRRCENTPGSFHCVCVPGYVETNDECLRVMDAPPPPVMQSLPPSGADNSHSYTLTGLTVDQLTSDVLQKFRTITAQAVNRYCNQTVCTVNEQSVMGLQILPENVAVPLTSVVTNSVRNPILSFYVQINESAFLSAESLQLATDSAENLYRAAKLREIPDLHLSFTQDSPIVSGRNVTAYIKSNEPMTKLKCRISGYPDVDCSSGMVHYSSLPIPAGNKVYHLRVEGTTDDGRKHIIWRMLRIEPPNYCTVNLINNGVTVRDGIVTIEFAPTGATVSTDCILNPPKTEDNEFLSCTSPITVMPGPGRHSFQIIPRGCGRRKKRITVEFEIPEE